MQKDSVHHKSNLQPKVRILTVVWGKDYINVFLRRCLLSLLAKRNLPTFVKKIETEVSIMTTSDSKRIFKKHPEFKVLTKLCKVKFVEIDDLICPSYGFVLTLAYARGVIDTGKQQLHTHFIFLNSDFILADGSLDTLADLILTGEKVVLAPSLRVSEQHFFARHKFPKSHRTISNT